MHVNYGPVRALTGASFTLDTGRICGLIGMNGSGKSTLFKAIMGVVPAHAGTITLDGQAVGGKRAHRHRAGIVSYVPQSEEIDWTFPISVREVVSMGRYRNLGITRRLRAADRAAVDEALARVELTDLADRQIGALSGGQRKRAFVARAIAQGAQLLLLDEPFAGVDKRSEAMLIQVIEQLRDEGATVLVSTHDLASLRQFADEALLLRGDILMHDTPEKVLAPRTWCVPSAWKWTPARRSLPLPPVLLPPALLRTALRKGRTKNEHSGFSGGTAHPALHAPSRGRHRYRRRRLRPAPPAGSCCSAGRS